MIALLERMEVRAANAMCGQHFISTAPILQAAMFAHDLGRHIDLQPAAVALVHHDAQLLGETFYGRFQPQQRRGAVFIDATDYSSKNRYALALQPTASAHLTVSLLLRFDAPLDKGGIERFLRTARFCGGQVVDFGDVRTFNDDTEVLAAMRNGYWLIERTDLVNPADPVDSVLQALATVPKKRGTPSEPREDGSPNDSPVTVKSEPLPDGDGDGDGDDDYVSLEMRLPESDEDDTQPTSSAGNSWLSPAVLGYATTTEFRRRAGVRADFEHAFAEPLIGLVQFVSVRQHETHIPWWSHGWLADDLFVVQQKKRYPSP